MQMYFNDAHLEGAYSVSIPFDGLVMNITLVMHDDQIDFSITACCTNAPLMQ